MKHKYMPNLLLVIMWFLSSTSSARNAEPPVVMHSVEVTGLAASDNSASSGPSVVEDEADYQTLPGTLISLPMGFEKNQGQFDDSVQFAARGAGNIIFFTPQEMVAVFRREARNLGANRHSRLTEGLLSRRGGTRDWRETSEKLALRVRFVGASPMQQVEGLDELPGRASYFIGNDPDRWQQGVPTYRRILYHELYPETDLVYCDMGGRLGYEFHLQPDADVNRIELAYKGAEGLYINPAGQLEIETAWGVIVEEAPLAWQETDGERVAVKVRYVLHPERRLGFRIGPYDASKLLVIEAGGELRLGGKERHAAGTTLTASLTPSYSTFVGGSSSDSGRSLVFDAGDVVVMGSTSSIDFPTTTGAYQTDYGGDDDIFVLRLSADGGLLLHSTFVGGSSHDYGYSLMLDGTGNAVVTGYTLSSDFPTTVGAYARSLSGSSDAFVVKLSSDGGSLYYSTFVGGTSGESGYALALDSTGNATVTGWSDSYDFPTTDGAYDPSFNGGRDVFILQLAAGGSSLLYSTFVGGAYGDYAYSLALDGAGNALVTGETYSSDFPTTGAYDGSRNGYWDAFAVKLSVDGSSLLYSTFIGGINDDRGLALALDGAGNAVITGETSSYDFPTTSGAYDESYNYGWPDVFMLMLSADGESLLYGTFIGQGYSGSGSSLVLDSSGNAIITGYTDSPDFPTTPGAYDTNYNGGSDSFLLKLSADASSLLYSTFVGGSNGDVGESLMLDSTGNAVVTGWTSSSDFPTTPGAYDVSYSGGGDAFVMKLRLDAEVTYSVSGHVHDGNGNPISGVMVSAGVGGSAITDANGAYTISGLAAGTYTLTPSKSGWTFTPPTRTASVPPDAAGQDFTGRISPRIIATIPANGAIQVPLDTPIIATFNMQVDPNTLNRDTVLVSDGSFDLLGNVTYDNVTRTVHFLATRFTPLHPATVYTVTLTDEIAAADSPTNTLQTYQWSFTTETYSLDSDHDGLTDVEEREGWLVGFRYYDSDPFKADTDGDGLNDLAEKRSRTDPRNADTDGDDLKDGEEDKLNYGKVDFAETDPRKWDTDGDGLKDGDDPVPYVVANRKALVIWLMEYPEDLRQGHPGLDNFAPSEYEGIGDLRWILKYLGFDVKYQYDVPDGHYFFTYRRISNWIQEFVGELDSNVTVAQSDGICFMKARI